MHLQRKKHAGPQVTSSDALQVASHETNKSRVGTKELQQGEDAAYDRGMTAKRSDAMCASPMVRMRSHKSFYSTIQGQNLILFHLYTVQTAIPTCNCHV